MPEKNTNMANRGKENRSSGSRAKQRMNSGSSKAVEELSSKKGSETRRAGKRPVYNNYDFPHAPSLQSSSDKHVYKITGGFHILDTISAHSSLTDLDGTPSSSIWPNITCKYCIFHTI